MVARVVLVVTRQKIPATNKGGLKYGLKTKGTDPRSLIAPAFIKVRTTGCGPFIHVARKPFSLGVKGTNIDDEKRTKHSRIGRIYGHSIKSVLLAMSFMISKIYVKQTQ